MTKELKNQDAINDDNSITFHMAYNKINHSATPIDVNDTVNKSFVDTHTNILFQTDWTKTMSADFKVYNKRNNQFSYTNKW